MCEFSLVVAADGHICGVHDWTGGFKPLKCPVRKSESDLEAYLSRLIHLGHRELANDLLERYCSGDVSVLVLIL
jgi:hypothetical protein